METASLFRQIDREIWVVTASAAGRRGGLTASWVSQATLDPDRPVVLIGLAPNHFTRELVDAAGGFAIHLLREDQAKLGLGFATGSGRDRDKLADLSLLADEKLAPVLHDCLAWATCRTFHRLDGGDRVYYWADVVRERVVSIGARPLREHGLFAAADPDQRNGLRADRDADVARHRPLHEQWRRSLVERHD